MQPEQDKIGFPIWHRLRMQNRQPELGQVRDYQILHNHILLLHLAIKLPCMAVLSSSAHSAPSFLEFCLFVVASLHFGRFLSHFGDGRERVSWSLL